MRGCCMARHCMGSISWGSLQTWPSSTPQNSVPCPYMLPYNQPCLIGRLIYACAACTAGCLARAFPTMQPAPHRSVTACNDWGAQCQDAATSAAATRAPLPPAASDVPCSSTRRQPRRHAATHPTRLVRRFSSGALADRCVPQLACAATRYRRAHSSALRTQRCLQQHQHTPLPATCLLPHTALCLWSVSPCSTHATISTLHAQRAGAPPACCGLLCYSHPLRPSPTPPCDCVWPAGRGHERHIRLASRRRR